MGAASVVAQVESNLLPGRAVASPRPGKSVGDFVEEYLVNVVVAFSLRQIARESDPLGVVITLAKAGFGVVKVERPMVTF